MVFAEAAITVEYPTKRDKKKRPLVEVSPFQKAFILFKLIVLLSRKHSN
jgi:hypothetical protein